MRPIPAVALCLYIACSVAPLFANGGDVCPGPLITSLPYIDSTGNTTNMNPDYPHCGISAPPGQRDVVYTLRLDCDYTVTASLCGSPLSSWVNIRTGGVCPGDSLVACDASTCGNLRGQVTFPTHGGEEYYVLVSGRCTALQCFYGPFILTLSGTPLAPPVNETCPGSLISSLPYSDSGCTTGAAGNYLNCVTQNSPDVVYTLHVQSCQTVTVSLCGSDFNTQLTISRGGACPGYYYVQCNDDAVCNGQLSGQSVSTFVAAPDSNYYIIIGGVNGATGHYVINVTDVPFTPANDVCPGTTVSAMPFTDFGDVGNTACATHNYDISCHSTTSPDVVYNYTPTVCQHLTASLCGSSYDTELDVRAGGPCPGAVSVACNDDYACVSGNTVTSQVSFYAYAGVTYYFIISGYQGDAGPFSFVLVPGGSLPAPVADVCPGVIIPSLPFTDIASTACMNHDYLNCLGSASPDAVYSFTSATCQNVTVSLCGSSFDTGLSILGRGLCPDSIFTACNNDNYCGGVYSQQSTLSFRATAGRTYRILVHGFFANSEGPYILNVTGVPCITVAVVDSLVIAPQGTNMALYWKSQGPAYAYKVYRSADPDSVMSPSNVIDSSTTPSYNDIEITYNPSPHFFYAVTAAELPTASLDGDGVSGDLPKSGFVAEPTSKAYFASDHLSSAQSEMDSRKSESAPKRKGER